MRVKMLLPLVALSAALAQGPRFPGGPLGPGGPPQPPKFDELKAYLNLTDSQIQSIQQARQRVLESQKTVLDQIQSKQQALHDLLEKGTSDALAVGKLMLEIRALQKQIEQAMAASRLQAVSFLTSEQKTKLGALEQAAKLLPAIQQAVILGLLEAPAPVLGGFGGPARVGPLRGGPGPGFRGRGPMARAVL